ncbi:MAG: hypothetical protein Q9186_003807 [Xanthomendoza sp. 1 TL-2023]
MSGRFKPFVKAVCGCLGITAVQQVGIDLDPVALSHVEDFVFDVLETLPAGAMFPSALPTMPSPAPSIGRLLESHWAVQLVMLLLLIVLSMLFGLYVDQSPPDKTRIIHWKFQGNAMTEAELWSQGALKHAGPLVNHRRNRKLDTAFKSICNRNQFHYIQKRRQRAIDQGDSGTVAADEVELIAGTTVLPATECSLAVPVYRNTYIDADILFSGSDAERILFALFLSFMFTNLLEGLRVRNRQLAATYDHIQYLNHQLNVGKTQFNDQGDELTRARTSQKVSEDRLEEEIGRNVALESDLEAQRQLSSDQEMKIADLLEEKVRSVAMESDLAAQKQLSDDQEMKIAGLRTAEDASTTRISVLTDSNTKLLAENNVKDDQLQQLREQLAEQKLKNVGGAGDAAPAPTADLEDPKSRTARKGPPGAFGGLRNQAITDLQTTNSKQAIRIVELEAQVEELSSSLIYSAGSDVAHNLSPSAANGNQRTANNRPPTDDEDIDAPINNIGKVAVKLPPKTLEPGEEFGRAGGVPESTTQSEIHSQYNGPVRITPLSEGVHIRDRKPYTDRKNAQGENQDHPILDGTGNEIQAAEVTPHKRHRRGRRKPKNWSGLGAGTDGNKPGSEGASLRNGSQTTEDA